MRRSKVVSCLFDYVDCLLGGGAKWLSLFSFSLSLENVCPK